ncbi:TetR/AcrR family transcriptional regulator [Nocardia brevicatena]|uniref:TetR/AcrR family transcriptional regulator n=1 Tax=Nocardia brevicatena TaxID=37327 RepID=UPI0003126D82|nr:TetR/AcrR family transcriptional regulator [Nocardia brevicatena]
MPTGVHIRDARQQLFAAAERVLLREGPSALTSRAVTTESGVAKGVLHRHFADFDAFLVELVQDRIARLEDQAVALRRSAGTGTVATNLTDALMNLFDAVAVAIVGLVVFRDELRARLRKTGPARGIPVLAEAGTMLARYLADERELGRIAADADVDSLALSLIGVGHLLFADRQGAPPDTDAVGNVVTTVIADVVQRRLL